MLSLYLGLILIFGPINLIVYNLYTHIATNPGRCRRFTANDSLITIFNCGLQDKYADLWSHNNYIVYVLEGKKIWHTSRGSFELNQGDCVFVKKGAAIVEQFFDAEFCLVLFFLPDDFICDVLKNKSNLHPCPDVNFDPVIPIDMNSAVQGFYQSMIGHFDAMIEPDPSLLELKFRELILTIAHNPANAQILAYFYSLLQDPQTRSLQRVMEDNFCYNLKLEEFARLCARSLSAFKRDFLKAYNVSPGKWLLEKRLKHAYSLLSNQGLTVADTAFESGFESPSHFSRAFRQRFGNSPLALKQQPVLS